MPKRRTVMGSFGLSTFRADQISRHVFNGLSDEVTTWTDLLAAIREDLAEQLFPPLLTQVRQLTADQGRTVKTLWRLHDGSLPESVLIHCPNRSTLCVSSQADCGMVCPLCAADQDGLKRNLSRAEITIQAFAANRILVVGKVPGVTGRFNNIVFTGVGESLANYKAVLGTIHTLIVPVPGGFGMSIRGITVSTIGLVPQIGRLAGGGLLVTLTVLLHAPDDDLHSEIVSVSNRQSVVEVVDAAQEYARVTRRRVSIEYTPMHDTNDSATRANLLADVLERRGDWGWVHVNLIPLNPTPDSRWTTSRPEDEMAFIVTLERHGMSVTLRDTQGSEIDGACGQLVARETVGV